MRPPFILRVRERLSDAAMRRIERRSRVRGVDWARLRTSSPTSQALVTLDAIRTLVLCTCTAFPTGE
jgi:hypothetical protein